MRSLVAVAIALVCVSSEARLPRQSGLNDVTRSDWFLAVFVTEEHFKPQFFGFGQQKTNWEEKYVVLYKQDVFKRILKEEVKVDSFPFVYYDGKEHWWYGRKSRWGKTMRFSAEKTLHKTVKIQHDPA